MNTDEKALLLHDLSAPLARARTYAKLLGDSTAKESAQLLDELHRALAELEEKLKKSLS